MFFFAAQANPHLPLETAPPALTEYDEPLARRMIEKVTVYEEKFTVKFKSGVTVDVGTEKKIRHSA